MAPKKDWFQLAFRLQGSVLPFIWQRILFFGGFSLLVVLAYQFAPFRQEFSHFHALVNNVACNLVLGLLLVFRTNTAYDRYWEGRKAWGTLVITLRNLAREVQVGGNWENKSGDKSRDSTTVQAEKTRFLNLIVAFALATKQHLRGEALSDEIKALFADGEQSALENAKHLPLFLSCCLSQSLRRLFETDCLSANQYTELTTHLNELTTGLTSCERIVSTPMPIAYNIYLKRLILIYCTLLPISLVSEVGWWTPVAILFVSFVLLGVDRIGTEIEDPFGYDANDLPLDSICSNLQNTIAQLAQFEGLPPLAETVETERVTATAQKNTVR